MIRVTFQTDRKRNPFQIPVIVAVVLAISNVIVFPRLSKYLLRFYPCYIFPESKEKSCVSTRPCDSVKNSIHECLEIQSLGREGGATIKPSFLASGGWHYKVRCGNVNVQLS